MKRPFFRFRHVIRVHSGLIMNSYDYSYDYHKDSKKQKPLIPQGLCASMAFSDYFNWLHDQDSNLEPSG